MTLEEQAEPSKLRPHHLTMILYGWCFMTKPDICGIMKLCGYSEQLIENSLYIYERIMEKGFPIQVVGGRDDICAKCDKLCDEERIKGIDLLNERNAPKRVRSRLPYVLFLPQLNEAEPVIYSPVDIISDIISGLEKRITDVEGWSAGDIEQMKKLKPVYERLYGHLRQVEAGNMSIEFQPPFQRRLNFYSILVKTAKGL